MEKPEIFQMMHQSFMKPASSQARASQSFFNKTPPPKL